MLWRNLLAALLTTLLTTVLVAGMASLAAAQDLSPDEIQNEATLQDGAETQDGAQETGDESSEEQLAEELAEGDDTLPVTQFYRDVEYFHGWHIQQNVVLRHYRLLDAEDKRHTWGSLAHCRDFLEEIKEEQNLPPMSGTAVIVLHGLGGWRDRMGPLCEYLEEETDYTIINVCYPSTRDDLGGHAEALAGIIEHLDGIERIYLVAHSMGNIVVRRYLADNTDPETGQQGDPRIERMVMLAPPNQGAQFAGRFTELTLYTLLLGDAAVALSPAEWEQTERRLATPAFPFGILAGSISPETAGNPMIVGEDDYLVGVEETKLAGASDFMILPLSHGEMNCDPTVCELALSFLEEGYFVSEADRYPLPAEEAGDEPAAPAQAHVGDERGAAGNQRPTLEDNLPEDNPFEDPFGDRLGQPGPVPNSAGP